MYGLTRGTMTLVGAAVAGFLLWFATQLQTDETGEYWAFLGLIAAAGLAMALSQLLGGWTKWGWPRVTGSVFVLGFLPALIAGGLVLLSAQPDSDSFGAGWAGDLGLDELAEDLQAVLPAIAFGLGLLFGLTFDTTGPGVREVTVGDQEARARRGYVGPVPVDSRTSDEPVAAERQATQTYPVDRDQGDRDTQDLADSERARTADTVVDRDRDGIDDRDEERRGDPLRRDERT